MFGVALVRYYTHWSLASGYIFVLRSVSTWESQIWDRFLRVRLRTSEALLIEFRGLHFRLRFITYES